MLLITFVSFTVSMSTSISWFDSTFLDIAISWLLSPFNTFPLLFDTVVPSDLSVTFVPSDVVIVISPILFGSTILLSTTLFPSPDSSDVVVIPSILPTYIGFVISFITSVLPNVSIVTGFLLSPDNVTFTPLAIASSWYPSPSLSWNTFPITGMLSKSLSSTTYTVAVPVLLITFSCSAFVASILFTISSMNGSPVLGSSSVGVTPIA